MDTLSYTSAGIGRAARECHIIIGNHASYYGIGEILYTLKSYFSGRYKTRVSERIVPNQINVIIDEFANPELVDYLEQLRQRHPHTRYVVMATEFITRTSLLGVDFGKTFNMFSLWDARRDVLARLAWQLRIKPRPPYLHARYLGFMRALSISDLILCAHPGILETMRLRSDHLSALAVTPLTLYPEIITERLADDRRLRQLPAGFVMTGTMTPFRQRIAVKLLRTFHKAGIRQPIYRHVAFDKSTGIRIEGQKIDFGYDDAGLANPAAAADEAASYIYNLNPPQRLGWPYSSPMRILRAILLGQIPVITTRFGDHEIESTALLWDGKLATAEKMWIDATVGRRDLVGRHLAAVTSYNHIAREHNSVIDLALEQMM